MLLREVFNFFICGFVETMHPWNKTVHSTMAYYVYVLLHNTARQMIVC
jgi:hypothetical protein